MKPTLSSDKNKGTCSTIISASCTLWHGPDLDCIDTCAGDSMVDVTVKMAAEICSLKTTLDLTDLKLECLADNCTGCSLCSAQDKVLKNILECIIKKHCLLQTQVDNLPTTSGGSTVDCPTTFSIDASCVETLAGRNLPTSPTNNQILQLIADATCTSYAELTGRIDQLNIDLIACCNSGGGGTSTIPQVNSSCLFVGLKDIDEAYILLDADHCSYVEKLGTTANLGTSFNPSSLCATAINDYLGLEIGGAFTLDASLTNIYDVLCALTEKVKIIGEMQATCCIFSCDDISIVILGEVPDVDTKLANLVFTFNGSINPPAGYTFLDTGSNVTFTDKNGTFITYTVDIFDDATYTDLALTGLDLSGNITMTANLKYSVTDALDNIYNCNKCIAGVITINNDCGVCQLNVTGGTVISVKVTYTYDGNTNVLIISSNGAFFVPKGAVITSIIDESSTPPTITTDCSSLVLPTPSTLKCWRFSIPSQFFIDTLVGEPENDGGEFSVTGIISNGIRYTLGSPGTITSDFGLNVETLCVNGSCSSGTTSGGYTASQAATSLPTYSSGGVDYIQTGALVTTINTLNTALGTINPSIKKFSSICTNTCGNCLTFRFVHVQTYTTTPPYLELTGPGASATITVVAQIQGEEIPAVDVDHCICAGE
jgi:hypothetical protein